MTLFTTKTSKLVTISCRKDSKSWSNQDLSTYLTETFSCSVNNKASEVYLKKKQQQTKPKSLKQLNIITIAFLQWCVLNLKWNFATHVTGFY